MRQNLSPILVFKFINKYIFQIADNLEIELQYNKCINYGIW